MSYWMSKEMELSELYEMFEDILYENLFLINSYYTSTPSNSPNWGQADGHLL